MDRRQNGILIVICGIIGSIVLFFYAISEQRFSFGSRHQSWSPSAAQKKAYLYRQTHHPHPPHHH